MSRPPDPAFASTGLIGQSGPVTFGARGPLPRPGVAVVYATRTGDAVVLPRRPSGLEVRRYQTWHEVDITRHQDMVQADVRSKVDSMQFRLQAEVTWGVSDPAAIVRYGTTDGVGPVRSQLIDRAWRITRRFDIEQCDAAEEQLQGQFESGTMILEEGITIFRAIIKLHSDAPTAQFQADQRHLRRTGITDQTVHENRTRQERWNAGLERDRIAALKQVATGEDDLLFLFLARHPDQVGSIIEQVGKRREINLSAQTALFDKMVDKGFIQEADIESMRQLLIRPMEQIADSDSSRVLGGAAPPRALEPGTAPAPGAAEPPPSTRAPSADGVVGWVRFDRAPGDQDTP
ncbi:hypothetical protein [Planomonospora venezuelensis]|uniref:SPFH domain / Band 7 family protein n=1 Tax=Planomonospora venezuelensis TaxID=1999 RepID=A0A841D5W0_PLAVE|nr:hypothetical protein [Planomonospora venezuelensis]MBB5966032.1 hypothetical protein [Planomonospora venezuelensis]GIN05698.1 hypothetical protein Pve01_73560 [Planomonospora venezuelensis]